MPWSRIFSGIVAIVLALGMILLGGWYFTLGFGILICLGQVEYFQLVRATGTAPASKTTLIVSQALLIISTLSAVLADAVLPVAGTFICFYLLFQPKLATIADISTSILGLFYGGYLPSYWVRLRSLDTIEASNLPLGGYWPEQWTNLQTLPSGLTLTLLAFGCIWAADIGAYTIGRLFGRTRLSEISPKKDRRRCHFWCCWQYWYCHDWGLVSRMATVAFDWNHPRSLNWGGQPARGSH